MCAQLEVVAVLYNVDWNDDQRPSSSLTPSPTMSALWHDQENTRRSKDRSLLLEKFGRLCWIPESVCMWVD